LPINGHTISCARGTWKARSAGRLRTDAVKHLTYVAEPRKIPVVLSPEEVVRFLEATPGVKYKAEPSVAYGAGLRVSEVATLKVSDIDSDLGQFRTRS
jgi:integrase